MSGYETATSAAQRIQEVIDDLPMTVMQAIYEDIGPDTYVGSAIRQNDGRDLLDYLSSLSPYDMGKVGERLAHADSALEQGHVLKHAPHCASLIQIVNGIADMAYKSSEDPEEQSMEFYRQLNQLAPMFPGTNSEGEPLAMQAAYMKKEEESSLGKFDVLAQAREELSADFIDPETKEYWEATVRRLVPALRDVRDIHVDEIPNSEAESNRETDVMAYNEFLGKGTGMILNALTGSNRADPPSGETLLTDTPIAPEVEAVESDPGIGMDSVDVAEPADTSTPDYYEPERTI